MTRRGTEAEVRLRAIRDRWARVSPTPWRLDPEDGTAVLANDGTTVATHSVDGWWAGSGPQLRKEDALAIAAAPDDVHWLLDQLEARMGGDEQ